MNNMELKDGTPKITRPVIFISFIAAQIFALTQNYEVK